MKTPAPLSKAFASIAFAAAFLRRIPGQIFGNISWRPPRWLSRIGESWSRLERAYPRLIAPGVLTIFAVLCASAWTWHWYSHLPKPHRVTAKITPIEVTKLEKELKKERALALERQTVDRDWLQKTVRWVVEWVPDTELALVAALGAIVRAAPADLP